MQSTDTESTDMRATATTTMEPIMKPISTKSTDSMAPSVKTASSKIAAHPNLTDNRRKIYKALLTIPPGRWTTYSALATHLDTSPRAIGTAMRMNPFVPEVPCHRVVAVDRSLCGYIHGLEAKRKLLQDEGVEFSHDGRVAGVCWEFS